MITTELRQWCGECQAATVSWICPYCQTVLCEKHQRECPTCDVLIEDF